MPARWNTLWFTTALLGMLPGSWANAQTATPPHAVRRAIEDHAVIVRVFDAVAGQVLSLGTALVVADDGESLTLATAEHVIEAARAMGASVELRFAERNRWIVATLLPPIAGDDGTEPDLAALRVERSQSPYGDERLAKEVTITAPRDKSERLWAYGYDSQTEQLTWRQAWLHRSDGDFIEFDGEDVVEGFSGGVLTAAAGPAGMIQRIGSRDKGHVALSYSASARLFGTAGVSFGLHSNRAMEGLTHAIRSDLAIGLVVTSANEVNNAGMSWVGIRLLDVRDGEFLGEARATDGSTSVRLVPTGADLDLQLDPALASPALGAIGGAVTLSVDSRHQIEGHLVLESVREGVRYRLAVPTASSELFVARLLVSGKELEGYAGQALASRALGLVEGRREPFPLIVLSADVDWNDFADSLTYGFQLSLPLALARDKLVRLSGRIEFSDDTDRPNRPELLGARVCVLEHRTRRELASSRPGSGRFALEFTHVASGIRLHHLTPTHVDGQSAGVYLCDLLIHYAEQSR